MPRSVSTIEILLTKPAPVTAILFGGISASGGAAQYVVTDRYISPPELVIGDTVGYMPISLATNAHMSGSPKVFWDARGAEVDEVRGAEVDEVRDSMGWPLRGHEDDDHHHHHRHRHQETSKRDTFDHKNESRNRGDDADKVARNANKATRTQQTGGVVVYASPQYFALEPQCLSMWVRAVATCAAARVNVTLAVTVNAYAHVAKGYISERARQCGVTLRWHQRVLSEYEYLRRASAADLYGMLFFCACMCVRVCVCACMYVYIHTHTHTSDMILRIIYGMHPDVHSRVF
jgi:hypothetical protein